MSCYDIDGDNDIDLMLINYSDYYLEELTYYGSSKIDQLVTLIGLADKLNLTEKNVSNYYLECVKLINQDITNPNVYLVGKIFFFTTNLIIKMIMLYLLSEKNNSSEEFDYKLRYLVGGFENYIEKFVCPIENELATIINSANKIFRLEYPIQYLKKFIMLNKNKFMSKEKLNLSNKLINLLNNI